MLKYLLQRNSILSPLQRHDSYVIFLLLPLRILNIYARARVGKNVLVEVSFVDRVEDPDLLLFSPDPDSIL